MINEVRLSKSLMRHEGLRLKPYKDTEGFWTIGVGRKVHDRYGTFAEIAEFFNEGITEEKAGEWLTHDMKVAELGARGALGETFEELDDVRQEVLCEMAFQMGHTGLKKFRKTLAFIREHRYEEAADEMLDSLWAEQTPTRAITLSTRFRRGEYNDS